MERVEIAFEEEKQFGDAAARQFIEHLKQQGLAVVARGRDVEYLQQLVETLRPQMENARRYRRLKVYLVDSPRTDARTFPGGTLFFFRGTLRMFTRPFRPEDEAEAARRTDDAELIRKMTLAVLEVRDRTSP